MWRLSERDLRSSQSAGFSSVAQQAAYMALMGGSPCAVQAERKGLDELSIRGIQLRHAAGGDMVRVGSSRVVEAEGGLEELSIRGFQLHHAAGGEMVLMGGSPCAV